MKIGFTGTQEGITVDQLDSMVTILQELNPSEARHGDCIGADETFNDTCYALDIPIVLHPPINESKRAFCEGEELPAKDYIERNHDIVDACDALIVCPKQDSEIIRSGTWATYRYAKSQHKPIFLILPDGTVQPVFYIKK